MTAKPKRPAETKVTWLPIDSAPLDGTDVLLYVRNPFFPPPNPIRIGAYGHLEEWFNGELVREDKGWSGTRYRGEPTHWAPMPKGPCWQETKQCGKKAKAETRPDADPKSL